MWFEETERGFEIFDSYNRIAKSAEKKPILLFNEADALFSKRKENTHSSTKQYKCDSEHNSGRNGTLWRHHDSNYQFTGKSWWCLRRRFLFKVKFDNPSAEIKVKIWQSTYMDCTGLCTYVGIKIQILRWWNWCIVRKITMKKW